MNHHHLGGWPRKWRSRQRRRGKKPSMTLDKQMEALALKLSGTRNIYLFPEDLHFPSRYSITATTKLLTTIIVVLSVLGTYTMNSLFNRITRPFSSSTMRFGPEGSGQSAAVLPEGAKKATIAAGCFWGVEHLYRHNFPKDAVLDARVGYIGGDTKNPSYRSVCSGRTGREFAHMLPQP